LGKEFIIESPQGQEIVNKFLQGENETKEGTFAIQKGSFVIDGTGTPFTIPQSQKVLDEPFEGNFTAKKNKEGSEIVNGDFSITSPRHDEKKVGRFTIQTLAPLFEEGQKKKKSLEKRKKLISLKQQSHEVNLITLQNQIHNLRDQNERQLVLLEKLIEKDTKHEELLLGILKEMKKLKEEVLKLKLENQELKEKK